MYKATHEFYDRQTKTGSKATEPTGRLTNTEYYGDKTKEVYSAPKGSREERDKLKELLDQTYAEMKKAPPERREPFMRQVKRLQAALKANKVCKPDKKQSFSQCFMYMAEAMLAPSVFEEIRSKTHDLYHSKVNELGEEESK